MSSASFVAAAGPRLPGSHSIAGTTPPGRRGYGATAFHGWRRSSTAFAVATTCSTVNPYLAMTSGPGADAPKPSTPMIAPAGPT
jgi:hypothetical protein